MKKTSKSILCLLFALIFVFQFVSAAGITAFADEDDEVEEAPSVAILVDGNDYSGAVSREELLGGIEFIPSENAYVASVAINGVGVTGYCIADGRVLTIDSDAVADLLDEEFSEDADSFSVSAVAEELPEEALESITAPAASEAELDEGEEFLCWKYRYENHAIVLVDAGDTFVPFMACELVGAIVTEAEEIDEALEGEELEGGEIEEAPADMAPLMMPLSLTPPAKYKIKIVPTDVTREYSGSYVAPTAYTLEVEAEGTAVTDPAELAKYELSHVVLGLKQDGTAGEYAGIGTYDIVVTDLSSIGVSYDGDDVSSVAKLLEPDVGTYEITKRTLTIKAKAVEKTYDGEILPGEYAKTGLLENHVIYDVDFLGETSAVCDTTYTVDPASVLTIENLSCEKVTDLYNIVLDTTAASYKITAPAAKDKIKLTAKAVDVTKGYTGSPVEGSITTTGELPKGAVVKATYDYQDAHTDIGSHKYSLKSIIVELDGHDTSAAFDIKINEDEATLKIVGHSYTITVKNASKEYDGSPLTPSDYKVEGLMEGDTIYAIALTGEQTEAGTSKSDVDVDSIVIHDASDNDVTSFYEEPTIVQGNLTVNKLAFTLTAKDASKIYDGNPLTRNEYSISNSDKTKLNKLGAWTLNVSVSGSIKEVGTAANKIGAVELKVGSNVIDPKNYEVTRVDGTLTVEADPTKPTVTITVESKSKVYDSTALILEPDAYTISDTLPSGWSIDVTLETASITAAGSKQVSVKEYKVYETKDNVKTLVTDPAKIPFNVGLKPGTLTVTKYPITITAKSGSKYYDGKEFVLNSVTITAANNKLASEDHVPDVSVEAQDADGNTVKAIKVGKYYNVVTQVVIKEGNKDVTSNYEITTVNGTLTIKNSNGNPATGDTSNISLWVTVLAVSAVAVVCIAVIFFLRNKKKAR